MKTMFTFFARVVFLTSLMVTSVLANSQVTDVQVYQLMDRSGFTKSIEGLPMQLQLMNKQMALTIENSSSHEEFSKVFLGSLNTDVMLRSINQSIKANVSLKEMEEILAWLDSELARRVIAAESQSAEPKFQQNLMRYITDLQNNPPSNERTEAILKYVQSAKIVEQSLKMVTSILENMFDAYIATQPKNTELAIQLNAQLEQMDLMLKPTLQQQMVLTSYFIYRDISEDDLTKYAEFYQNGIGQKYTSLISDATADAMGKWGKTLVGQIEKARNQ